MSWPQWPQPPALPPQAGSTTSVPSLPVAASSAAASTAQPSTYTAAAGMQPPAQYTAAQFAALTPEQQFAIQQNWQQWQTYHQQYAQWHAQYGEQYQREMQAKLGAVAPSLPYVPPMPPYAQPSPTFNVPPPLPAQANSGQQISNMAAAACQPPPPPPPPEDSVKESMQPAPPQPVTAPNYPGFLSALSQYGGSAGQKSEVPPQPSGPPPQQPLPPKPPGPPPNVGLSHYSSQSQFSGSQQFPGAANQYNTAPPPLPNSFNSASQQNAPQQVQQRNYPPPLMQIDPHSVAPPDSYRQNQNQNNRRDQQSQNWRQNEGRNFRDNRNDRRSLGGNNRNDNRNFQDRDRFDDCQDNSDWKSLENRNQRNDEGPQVLKSFNAYANEDDSEKTPEERAFDEQFRKWEEEFENWKKQNANHPDRKAYSEYEMKFEDCRRKLLERREQMRKRKLERKLRDEQEKEKLQQLVTDKTECPDRPERLHRSEQHGQSIIDNQTSQNQEQARGNIMAEQMDTKTEEAKTENMEAKDVKEGAKVEEKIEFLKTTSKSDGIPGLDLLPETTGKPDDNDNADEDTEVIDLEEENKLAFDQEDDNPTKENEERASYISSNKSEIPSLLSKIVEKPSFSPEGKDLSFGDFLRKETVNKLDENPFHSQDRKEIPLLDEVPKLDDFKQPGNIMNPFAGDSLTDVSKLISNPEPLVREEKGVSPGGRNNENNQNPNLMQENLFRNIVQESNPGNNMETNPGGVNDLAQALADPNVLALLSAALTGAGGNATGIAELGALLTQGNQIQNQMNQPRVSPWISGQAPFSGQNQNQNTRFNQGNNFDGNRSFPAGNIWQDKNRGDSGNSPWGNRNADMNDNRRNSLLWRDNPWQNNSNFGDQRNSSFDDQRFGDARKQSNFDDQRNSRFGDSRNSSFDDQRNSRFGDQRGNFDDQRNSRFGDRNSRFGDQRNNKFGEQRNLSFGEQRNQNFGDQRNSSFGDQRNSNFGDQRNSNFGDQRNSNFGDQRNSNLGEQRNSSFGDQRNSNFGDQRNSNFGEQRNTNFGDQRNSNVEDQQRNPNFGEQRSSNVEEQRNLNTDRNTSIGGGPRKSRFDNPSDAGFGGNQKDTTTEEQANSNTDNKKDDVTDPKDNVAEQPKPTKQDDIDMRDSVFERAGDIRSSVGSHKDDRSRSSDKFPERERVNPFKDSDDRNRANPFKDNDERGTRGASRTGDRRSGSRNRNSRDRSRSSSRHDDVSNLEARRNPFRSEGNIFDKPLDVVPPSQDDYFRPAHVIDYQNKPLGGGGGGGGDSFGGQNDMLCPTKIVDYGHMPSNQPSKCDDDYFPMKTIDYGHSSANTVSDYDHRSNSQSFKFQNQRSKRRNKKSGLESNPSYPNEAWCLLNPESHNRPGLPSKRGKRKKRQVMNELTNNIQVGKKFLSDDNIVTAQATENCEEISDDDNQEFDEPPPQSAESIPECGEMEPNYIDDVSPQNFSDALSNIFPSVFPINNNNSSSLNKSENILKAKCSTNNTVEYNTKNTISIKDILCKPGRFSRSKKICIIFRGPPGSGKSYFAKLIKDKEVEMGGSAPRILSIDDYFMTEVDKEEKCPKTGIKITKKEMVYEYEKEMENSYMQYLLKSFKKTINDRLFDFIIIDCHNHSLTLYNEFYNVARDNQFTPYTIDLLCDVQTCLEQNIHNRLEDDIRHMINTWDPTPEEYIKLDVRALLEDCNAIREIEMEDISDMEDELDRSQESNQYSYATNFMKSKWDTDPFEDKLARLDGTNKVLQKAKNITLEEYLQMDGWEPPASTSSNKKRVRWADIEEKREQDKMRAIGFVVGQTDWNRMMDPTGGSSALTKTKYIARVKKN